MKVSLLPLPVFNYMSEDTLFDKINAHVKYDLITDQDIYAIRNGKMLADCKLVWPDGVPYSRFNRPSYMTNMFEKPMPTVTATDTFEDLTNKRAVDLVKKYSNTAAIILFLAFKLSTQINTTSKSNVSLG